MCCGAFYFSAARIGVIAVFLAYGDNRLPLAGSGRGVEGFMWCFDAVRGWFFWDYWLWAGGGGSGVVLRGGWVTWGLRLGGEEKRWVDVGGGCLTNLVREIVGEGPGRPRFRRTIRRVLRALSPITSERPRCVRGNIFSVVIRPREIVGFHIP